MAEDKNVDFPVLQMDGVGWVHVVSLKTHLNITDTVDLKTDI